MCRTVEDARMRERTIQRLAARQHGVITRAQLLDAGLEPGTIDRRLAVGRLRALRRGLYLVGSVVPPLAREMAAVLACAPRAVLSNASAAPLWKLRAPQSENAEVEVTAIGRNPGPKPGIRIHRVRSLGRDETRTFKRIPVTTPARTILDIAPTLRPRELEQAVAEARRRGIVSSRELLTLIDRYPARHGVPALRHLLEAGEPALTRSAAEERCLALVRAAGLPEPEVNARVAAYEVDFLWPAERVVVEVDGFGYHGDRAAFERDRVRDAALAAAGYRVIRVTWRQISGTPIAVAARIAQVLAVSARSS